MEATITIYCSRAARGESWEHPYFIGGIGIGAVPIFATLIGGIGIGAVPIPVTFIGGMGMGAVPIVLIGGIGIGAVPIPATFFRIESPLKTTKTASTKANK